MEISISLVENWQKRRIILEQKMVHLLERLHHWGFTPLPPNNGSTIFVAYFNNKVAVSL